MDSAKGEVTYCQGKDTSGNAHYMVDEFNKKFGAETSRPSSSSSPPSADEQRNQFIQRQQAKSGDCDVFSSDVIWTAEFASQKWLYDMTPYMEDKKARLHRGADRDRHLRRQDLGLPGVQRRRAPLLQHRQGQEGPRHLAGGLRRGRSKSGGIVYQGAPYEGLTCDFLELFFGAGGEVLSEDGTKSTIAAGERVVKALQFMVDGIKDGAAPKAVTTYMEPESLAAFQTGKYAYMRNWPYAYALNQKAQGVKDNFEVAPQPDVRGRREGRHPRRPQQRHLRVLEEPGRGAEAGRLHRLAGDPEGVRGAVQPRPGPGRGLRRPGGQEGDPVRRRSCARAITQARARPVSPVYPQISQAIYKNVNAALVGPDVAGGRRKKAQADIEKALSTF